MTAPAPNLSRRLEIACSRAFSRPPSPSMRSASSAASAGCEIGRRDAEQAVALALAGCASNSSARHHEEPRRELGRPQSAAASRAQAEIGRAQFERHAAAAKPLLPQPRRDAIAMGAATRGSVRADRRRRARKSSRSKCSWSRAPGVTRAIVDPLRQPPQPPPVLAEPGRRRLLVERLQVADGRAGPAAQAAPAATLPTPHSRPTGCIAQRGLARASRATGRKSRAACRDPRRAWRETCSS